MGLFFEDDEDEPKYCTPQPEKGYNGRYIEYGGWHMKPLRKYEEHQAKAIAEKFGCRAFYCEYGKCWHLGR